MQLNGDSGECLRWMLPLAVVIPMLALASALRLPEAVFPEGAALAAGLWTLNNPLWACSRTRLLVLPPVCAALGVILAAVPLPRGLAEIAALLLGLAVLQAARSRLAPCLSAAMFPVVFGIHGWVFPAVVAVICAVVALGHLALPGGRARRSLPSRWPARVVGAYALVAGAWIAAGHLIPGEPTALFAPPVFVSGLDWAASGRRTTAGGVRRWLLLIIAALVGGCAALLPGPSWAAGSLAIFAVMLAARILRDPHPPALAVSLIPFVLSRADPLIFAAAVSFAAAVLLLAAPAVPSSGRPESSRPGGYPLRETGGHVGSWASTGSRSDMSDKAAPASPDAEANDAADRAPETEQESGQPAPAADDVKQKFREALDRKRAAQHDHQSAGGRSGKISGTHGPAGGGRSFRRKSG